MSSQIHDPLLGFSFLCFFSSRDWLFFYLIGMLVSFVHSIEMESEA